MRACKAFLALLVLAVGLGAVQASSRQDTLRLSLTIVDRCDIRDGRAAPTVDCSTGVPWMLAPATGPTAPSLVAIDARPSQLPVPAGGPVAGAQVTTIVF